MGSDTASGLDFLGSNFLRKLSFSCGKRSLGMIGPGLLLCIIRVEMKQIPEGRRYVKMRLVGPCSAAPSCKMKAVLCMCRCGVLWCVV